VHGRVLTHVWGLATGRVAYQHPPINWSAPPPLSFKDLSPSLKMGVGGGVRGTKPKRGTSYAFSFLTASVITPRRRLVLCVIPLTGRKGLTASYKACSTALT